MVEFAGIHYPLVTQSVPEFYTQLGRDREQYALLEVPVADKSYGEYTQAMQRVHGKPILGGQTARKPCHCFADYTPVVRWFTNLRLDEQDDITPALGDPASYAPAVLRQFDIRYIILYRSLLKPNQYVEAEKLVRTVLPGASPTYSDTVITAYVVPTATTDPRSSARRPRGHAHDWHGRPDCR